MQRDLLETVIGLGPNLFYGTGISACILIFRLKKDSKKANKVYFIDGSELFTKGRNQNFFEEKHAKQNGFSLKTATPVFGRSDAIFRQNPCFFL